MILNHSQNRVNRLIDSLSDSEKNTILPVSKALLPPWMEESKVNKLFRSIVELDDPFEKESISFSRKNYEHLEDEILETLMLDNNLKRKSEEANELNEEIYLDKELIKVKILKSKGVLDRAFGLAETCKDRAVANENFNMAIAFLNVQLSIITLHHDPLEFRKRAEEIDQYAYNEKLKNNALFLLNELQMKKYFQINENLDYFIEHSLRTLYKLKSKFNSRTIQYVHDYFIKERWEMRGNYQKALECLIDLYEPARTVSRSCEFIDVWDLVYEQGRLFYELNSPNEARVYLRKCLDKLPDEHPSFRKAAQLCFFLDFKAGDYKRAEEVVNIFTRSNYFQVHLEDETCSVWEFYTSCVYFMQGDFKRSLYHIQKDEHFKRMHAENYLQIKILEILNLAELRDFDESDRKISTLKRYIKRHELQGIVKKMGLKPLIPKITLLSCCSYDYALFSEKISANRDWKRRSTPQLDDSFLHLVDHYAWFRNSAKQKMTHKGPKMKIDSLSNSKSSSRYSRYRKIQEMAKSQF